MSITSTVVESMPGTTIPEINGDGPITRRRLWRSRMLHLVLCAVGLTPWLLDLSPALQAAGWGLWLPGIGFVAAGGWVMLLFPVTLLLFALAFFAWFGSGMIIAPILVWGLAAVAAGLVTDGSTLPQAHLLIPAITAGWLVFSAMQRRKRLSKQIQSRDERNQYLTEEISEVRRVAVAAPPKEGRELAPDQLGMIRYLLDRALQPVGQLEGFDKIDQFQTSALRYQINMIGYGLSGAQRHYTPNFHGYLSEAQRRLFEQYCQRQIWGYWAWENAWGNFSLDKNPAAKDNIMLTGYININLLQYMNNTGDDRYTKPGSMNFIWNQNTHFPHDIHSINQSILDNFRRQEYCLYPCEPNWIYPACNLRGLLAVALYDTVFGTEYLPELLPAFRKHLEAEFINPDGLLVSLRSKHTGHALPFPVPPGGMAKFLHPVFPDLAEVDYAIARRENVERDNGELRLKDMGKAIDFGNYQPGYGFVIDGVLSGAAELGDLDYVAAAKRELQEKIGRVDQKGVISWEASNLANAMLIESQLAFKDAWKDSVLSRPSDAELSGPILAEASYPEVLVAKAISHTGEDLELVLYPGRDNGAQTIGLERLQPGRSYCLQGAMLSTFAADAEGKATVSVPLNGRTALHVTPAELQLNA
jgi:hypothetical protein